MISLDQVRLLEQKVENAVNKILQLQKENAEFKEKCAFLESQASNLNQKVSNYESDQNKIEEGIVNALKRLNVVEDAVKAQIELESSNNPITEDTSTVFVENMTETVDSSDTSIPTEIQEESSNPVEYSNPQVFPESSVSVDENTFQLEIPEETLEEANPETIIDIPKNDFPSDGFNFNEPSFETEENQQTSNQFDIF